MEPKRIKQYWRKECYSVDEVLSKVVDKPRIKDPKTKLKYKALVKFDGDLISMNSDRYRTFLRSGVKCVCCGIEGTFFAKEKNCLETKSYHFNLYGINEKGEEVMLTKDHIIPKAEGGKNDILNYQTMCSKCNYKKGPVLMEPKTVRLPEDKICKNIIKFIEVSLAKIDKSHIKLNEKDRIYLQQAFKTINKINKRHHIDIFKDGKWM